MKLLSAIIAIVLMFTLIPLSATAETEHQIEEKVLTLYVGAIDSYTEIPLYFMDGVKIFPGLNSTPGVICSICCIPLITGMRTMP